MNTRMKRNCCTLWAKRGSFALIYCFMLTGGHRTTLYTDDKFTSHLKGNKLGFYAANFIHKNTLLLYNPPFPFISLPNHLFLSFHYLFHHSLPCPFLPFYLIHSPSSYTSCLTDSSLRPLPSPFLSSFPLPIPQTHSASSSPLSTSMSVMRASSTSFPEDVSRDLREGCHGGAGKSQRQALARVERRQESVWGRGGGVGCVLRGLRGG